MDKITHGFGMGIFGWIFPLAFIFVFLYLIKGKEKNKQSDKSAVQDILDRRYASGGISKEEYEEKSRDLQEHA